MFAAEQCEVHQDYALLDQLVGSDEVQKLRGLLSEEAAQALALCGIFSDLKAWCWS